MYVAKYVCMYADRVIVGSELRLYSREGIQSGHLRQVGSNLLRTAYTHIHTHHSLLSYIHTYMCNNLLGILFVPRIFGEHFLLCHLSIFL